MYDFHLHTWCSDGNLAPRELLGLVRQQRLTAFAVTDHDTLAGWQALCGEPGLIPGVEVTAADQHQEVHVVALGIRPGDPPFLAFLAEIRARRIRRIEAILDRLPKAVRRGLTINDLRDRRAADAGQSLGRYHLARGLTRLGGVASTREAFSDWIGDAHLTDPALPGYPAVADTCAAIRSAGGVAILAHPGVYRTWPRILELMAQGCDGIEADHPGLDATLAAGITAEGRARRWLMSLGTDLHSLGARAPGQVSLAADLLRPLLDRLGVAVR